MVVISELSHWSAGHFPLLFLSLCKVGRACVDGLALFPFAPATNTTTTIRSIHRSNEQYIRNTAAGRNISDRIYAHFPLLIEIYRT